jgi:hypothetical protein
MDLNAFRRLAWQEYFKAGVSLLTDGRSAEGVPVDSLIQSKRD